MAVKFNLHNAVNTETGAKARINYSLDGRHDQKPCVWVFGKDILEKLEPVFGEVINETDSMTDYFEKDRVVMLEDHPLYVAARAAAERRLSTQDARIAKKRAR